MRRHLPPLLALRHFEAVGRNLSFTLAASELNVTQAAVSHQIRLLEQHLGVKLFVRMHQRIKLTEVGLRLLQVASGCLDQLSDAVVEVTGRGRTERIHLSITPLVSSRWLMPRLGEYTARSDSVEIVLHHSLDPPSERDTRYDVKIFFTTAPSENPAYQYFFHDSLIPVCSPALIETTGARDLAAILGRVDIIHEFGYEWWSEWCCRVGLDPTLTERGLVVDDPTALENAALHGHGIILGSRRFLDAHLTQGRLIAPFGIETSLDIHYYLVCNPTAERRHAVRQFRAWLTEKGASETADIIAEMG